jgi:hypothetical protein
MFRELVFAATLILPLSADAAFPPCGPETDPAAEIIVDRPPSPAEIASAPDPTHPVILIFDHYHCRGPDFKWVLTSSVPRPRNN